MIEERDRAVAPEQRVIAKREILAACPICGATRWRRWRRGYDRAHLISRQRFEYVRCLACGVAFERVRPLEGEMAQFYPKSYYGTRPPLRASRGRRAASVLARLNGRLARRMPDALPSRLDRVYEPPRPGAVLLDYGCGSSTLLDAAHERGWATMGADISERVLAEVRDRGHDALPASPEALHQLADHSLALVRLNHVVEHLYRPKEVLSVLARKIEPSGLLHIATPNPESWGARLLRSFWLGLDCPRHVVLYPPSTLERVLHDLGFRHVEIHQEILTKDFARSIGHLLHGLRLVPHREILAMADRPWLQQVLDAPLRLAAYRGASDRYHCFAIK